MPKIQLQEVSPLSVTTPRFDSSPIQSAAEGLSRAVGDVADMLQRKDDEERQLELARKASEFRNKWLDESLMRRETAAPGARGYRDSLLKDYDTDLQEFISSHEDEREQRYLTAKLGVDYRDSLASNAIRYEAEQRLSLRRENVDQLVKNNRSNVAMQPEKYGQLLDETEQAIAHSGLPANERVEAINKARNVLSEDYVSSLPEAEQLGLFNRMRKSQGFDSAVDMVLYNEGGFNPDDMGAPAMMGINGRWWPKQLEEVKQIYATKGEAAAKEYASKFYKENFWNKYDIGELPENVQTVVLDGTVNHSISFAKRLVKAARDGATPDELLNMRHDEYQRLAESDKYASNLPGWINRLDNIATDTAIRGNVSPEFVKKQRQKITASQQSALKQDIDNMQESARLGIATDKSVIEQYARRADALDMGDTANSLRRYSKVHDEAVEFAKLPFKQQGAMLEEIGQKAANTPHEIDRYAAQKAIYDEKIKMLQKNPWEYYVSRDVVEAPKQIDFTSGIVEVSSAINERRAAAREIENLEEGAVQMPLITGDELDQLKDVYQNATPDQAAAVLQSITGSMDASERRVVSQLAAKDDPKLATILASDFDVARKLIAGDKTKGVVDSGKLRKDFFEEMVDYIKDPESIESLFDSVHAYYKWDELQTGTVSTEPDGDMLTKAIEAVVGKREQISTGGDLSYIFIPDDMEVGEVEDTLRTVNDDFLKSLNLGKLPMTADGVRIDASQILEEAVVESVGDGMYAFSYPGLGEIQSDDGNPLTIDVRYLKKYLTANNVEINPRKDKTGNSFMRVY